MICDRFAAGIPMPGFFYAVALGLAIGYLIARVEDRLRARSARSRRAERTPSMIKKKVDSLNAQYGAYVLLFCAMVSTLAVVIGIAQLRANAAQDRQRVQDNASLLECVSNWGSSLTATLPPIRKASQARDDALADALSGQKGLRGALTKVSGGNFTPADLADLIRALNALQKADTELRAARAANPYPPPPSLTCDLP